VNFLDNVKMGPKLIAAFLLTALFAVFVGVFGIVKIRTVDAASTRLYEKMTIPLGQMGDMLSSFQRTRMNLRDAIMTGDTATFGQRISELDQELDKAHAEVQKTTLSDEGRAIDQKVTDLLREYRGGAARVISLTAAGKRADAEAYLRGAVKAKADELNKSLDVFMDLKTKQARETSDLNTVQANSAVNTMIVVMILAALVGIGIGIVIARSISNPVQRGAQMMKEMAKGHLGLRLKMDRKDEIGELAEAMDGCTGVGKSNLMKMVTRFP
jgi:methyl-accepting chemotaxis protein